MNGDPERHHLIHPDVDIVAVTRLWEEFDGAPEPAESTAEILDRNYYETIRRYDPAARLRRNLDLRVYGPVISGSGQLNIDIAKDLFAAFEAELAGAARASGMAKPPGVELAGISPGSAILHLAPAIDEDHPTDEQMQVVVDQFDTVVAKITALHHVAESEGDLRAYADQATLLKGLRGLVSALDRHDLCLDIDWRLGSGAHRRSTLSARARTYVRRQWEEVPTSVERSLTGMVVKLDMNGTFSLNTAATGKRLYEVHTVDREQLLSLHLNLGDQVSVLVKEQTRMNRVGISAGLRYELVRIVSRAEMVTQHADDQPEH